MLVEINFPAVQLALETFIEEIGSDIVTLDTETDSSGDFQWIVRAALHGASSIWVRAEEETMVQITIGSVSYREIWKRDKVVPGADITEKLLNICRSAAAGFTEKVRMSGQTILWSEASLQIQGRNVVFGFGHPLSGIFGSRKIVCYAPYFAKSQFSS